ncbi:MAG: hypothetical protein HC809_05545, partial [Gammaproteobacteria bacterium]|nr:hypothetical protein [Gammaproteobacteria bacterium]
MLALLIGYVMGCAGRPPVIMETDTASCPDISGSYCATGSQWRKGSTELSSIDLMWLLGVKPVDPRARADAITIAGVNDASIRIDVLRADEVVGSALITHPDFRCGDDQVMVKMSPQ